MCLAVYNLALNTFPLKWLKLEGGGEALINSVCRSIHLLWRVLGAVRL